MKKLLSILGSLGMVASAGMAVVACSDSSKENNPSHSYSDFQSWVADSKNNHNTDLVFIGGRNDIDSLSFLAAEKTIAQGSTKGIDPQKGIDNLISDNDSTDEAFSNVGNNQKEGWSSFVKWAPQQSKDSTSNNYSELVKKFWGNTTSDDKDGYTGNIKMHTLLVDNVNDFFKNGVGKQIRDGFLKDQVKQWMNYDFDSNKTNQDKPSGDTEINNAVLNILNPMSDALKGAKGPFFIVLNNGNLAGITTGFKNYNQFTKQTENKPENDLTVDNVNQDMSQLFKSINNNIWADIYSYISNNFFPGSQWRKKKDLNKFILTSTDTIPTWKDNSLTGKTYSKDNTSKMPTDTTFKVDLKKYIA